jgi:asparagine synthase (glutamine-hydrolysing)
MCGILGVGGPSGASVVKGLIGQLAHRGPDGEGVWASPELSLGHRRLAIIGLDADGRQPMRSRSGASMLVFNGEIYNYLELAKELEAEGRPVDRRFDSSVLLEALEHWGRHALPRLNGMFAFAWYRPRERIVLLARDRWGEKPLFWGRLALERGEPALVFSSELRTFARVPGGPPPCDPLGIARYLVYDGMPDEQTVYRDVYKVPASGWLELDPHGQVLDRGRFWEFRPRPSLRTNETEAGQHAVAALDTSVELRLRSDVPVGLFLSGGMDSSVLAALWRRLRPGDRIPTFTVGFDDPSYDERASARLMAEAIGAEHHELVLSGPALEKELDFVWDRYPEPLADPSIIPTQALCRFARGHVTVALSGDGGDEIQAGYDPFRAWTAARWMESILPRGLCRRAVSTLERLVPASSSNMSLRFKLRHFAQGFLGGREERVQHWLASFPVPDALEALRPELRAAVDAESILEPTRRAFEAVSDLGEMHAQMHVWLRTYMECNVLTKMDRASMMHSLEVRAPYLDPGVVGSLTDVPAALIQRHGRGKQVLRSAARDLLPRAVLQKAKKGFGVPQAAWLRTVLRDRMEEALRRSRTEGWFRHDVVEAMWRDHLSGREDHRRGLWNFLFSFPFQAR